MYLYDAKDAVKALRAALTSDEVKRFTPEEFAESVLLFVNERDPELKRQIFWSTRAGTPRSYHGGVQGLDNAQRVLETWLSRITDKKDVDGRIELARLLVTFVEKTALLPEVSVEATLRGPVIRTKYYYVAQDEVTALAIGTLHLLEVVQRGEKKLCRCQLDGCGKWFFAYRNTSKSKLGLPQHLYCTPEHTKQAMRARKARAARNRRARRNVARKPK